jgi:NAD(P)-dependent dehydrogenase (short-subunit alcohol dehydrogenase family)
MQSFDDKIAVITGGGTGMGRELVCQLVAAGAHVAMCDVSQANMDETRRLANAGERRVTTHICDVSDESQMLKFRDEVLQQHQTEHINLLFNNAGIGGGGSFVQGEREDWERTFAGVLGRCLLRLSGLYAGASGRHRGPYHQHQFGEWVLGQSWHYSGTHRLRGG